jgi:hypothetical protein
MKLSLLLGIALFIMLTPFACFSTEDTRRDSVCFDTLTASNIMNDIQYMDCLILQKSDSIATLKLDIVAKTEIIEKKNKQIDNKNTGLWVSGGVALLTNLIQILFFR